MEVEVMRYGLKEDKIRTRVLSNNYEYQIQVSYQGQDTEEVIEGKTYTCYKWETVRKIQRGKQYRKAYNQALEIAAKLKAELSLSQPLCMSGRIIEDNRKIVWGRKLPLAI